MWMPITNDEKVEFPVPMHENLEVVSVSIQDFGNCELEITLDGEHRRALLTSTVGARRLITYRRLPEGELSDVSMARKKADDEGYSADDLNAFRRVVCTINGRITRTIG